MAWAPDCDIREIARPGSLHDGARLSELRFRRGNILVRDIHLLFEGVKLRILEYLPPGPADDGLLRLRHLPFRRFLVGSGRFVFRFHIVGSHRTGCENDKHPRNGGNCQAARLLSILR